MLQTRTRSYLVLAAGMVAISWSAILVRWAAMPAVASAFYRTLFAALALAPCLLDPRRRASRSPGLAWAAVLSGVFFAGDLALYNMAVLNTSAGNATFLGNNAPVFVGLLSWGLTRRLPPGRFWSALVLALAGTMLIVLGEGRNFGRASAGDLMALGAAFCFALFLLATGRLRQRMDSLSLVAFSTAGSASALLAVALGMRLSLAIPSLASLAALFGLALICQLAGHFSLTWAMGRLPATTTSITVLGVAPLTALLAFALFHEAERPLQIAGDLLLLAGIWQVNRPEQPAQPV